MSSVQIFHRDTSGAETLISVVDGDLIKSHSASIRNLIATNPAAIIHKVSLSGPTPEGLKYVVGEIEALQSGTILDISVSHIRDIRTVIDIHRAVHSMRVEPAQTKIEGHLNGYLSKKKIPSDEMLAVHESYSAPGNPYHRTWQTMVQTLAYELVYGDMSETRQRFLREAALQHPSLCDAIGRKIKELASIKQKRIRQAEKRAERGEEQ